MAGLGAGNGGAGNEGAAKIGAQPKLNPCTEGDSFENGVTCRIKGATDHTIFVPPFVNINDHFKYNTHYKLATCVIVGDYAPVLASTSCLLEDPALLEQLDFENFTAGHGKIQKCNDTAPFSLRRKIDLDQLDEDTTRLAVIVNPIDRFITAFHKFCMRQECYGCKKSDMLCALIGIEKRLMMMARGIKIKRTKVDFAFAPQSWFCQFNEHLLNTTMIKLGMDGDEDQQLFIEELTSLLAKKGVNDTLINMLKNQLEDIHIGNGRNLRRVRAQLFKNWNLKTRFLRIYGHDFTIFGYENPLKNQRRAEAKPETSENGENEEDYETKPRRKAGRKNRAKSKQNENYENESES
ncbi:hypothetical protein WR25_21084 [Diploscapter pachys]|uniref:Uncharacterized protein n=1 Tax=Diploscapter pachys TaxID=2018661 RepID=A0A2A2KFK8_9BILA|nr:hypothetical protein WR25_21084 [Diploscapter pachys]